MFSGLGATFSLCMTGAGLQVGHRVNDGGIDYVQPMKDEIQEDKGYVRVGSDG